MQAVLEGIAFLFFLQSPRTSSSEPVVRRGAEAAYVRGARGRRMRPVLVPGNLVQARLRSRTEEQLAHAEIELVHSRAPLLSEPLPASAIDWVTALTATALPEAQPYPRLYDALDALLALI